MKNGISPLSNQILGYLPDTRLLIINADDFGMCHAVNQAVTTALISGGVCSASLMMPCPWALHAVRFLAAYPDISFAVHLTVIAEWADYRWGPLTPRKKVPSLIDETGYFYNFDRMPEFLAQVNLAELETEFRAQIEAVLAAGLQPTHLDWHCLRLSGAGDIPDLMTKLAQEYGLALRVIGQPWREKLQSQGLPTIDYDFLDSYSLEPATKVDRYAQLLRELPAGLSEWAVHPGLDTPELLAIEPGYRRIRQTDFDFLTSPQTQEIIAAEGIILLDYRALQQVWQAA